jgi:hypothetical protein
MPKLNMNWSRNEPSSPRNESAGKDMVPYPHVIVNCTVQLERLDPAMLMLPQTQKKEVSSTHRKYTKEVKKTRKIRKYTKEERRTFALDYRKRQMKGFNVFPAPKRFPAKKSFLAQTY